MIDIKKILRKAMALLAILPLALPGAARAQSQSTTSVKPRQYVLLNSVLFTNTQVLSANSLLPNQGLGYTNVGVFTNTFLPFGPAHAIGLICQIVNSNNYSAASNCVVTVFPAYDIGGGNSSTIGLAYGTNFSPTPLLTWTISYKTNTVATTNILATQWEPATSLGYTVSIGGTATTGGAASNLFVTLTQTVTP